MSIKSEYKQLRLMKVNSVLEIIKCPYCDGIITLPSMYQLHKRNCLRRKFLIGELDNAKYTRITK